MARTKEPFSIVKPAKKGRSFRYRLSSDPKRRLKSTGKKTQREAIAFCEALIKVDKRGTITFGEFAKDFFISDKCPYLAIRRRTGNSIDENTIKDLRERLEHYLIPAFGTIQLQDLSVSHWDDWLTNVEAGKVLTNTRKPRIPADATINTIRGCFVKVLDVAVRQKIIPVNIARLTESMSQQTYRARDPLNDKEISILFPDDEIAILGIWGTIERVALFSLLLTSGLRSGEIQALTWGKVWFEKNGIIIDQAVKYSGKIGEPKGKIARALPIPKKTMTRLANWKSKSTHKADTDFVFHQRNQIDPVRGDTILVLFKKALKKMNINSNKNLVIHSFRHTFTTVMSETLPAESVMAFTGHKSIQMIERYTHPDMKNALSNMKNKFDSNVTSIWDDKLNSQIPAETNLIGENWNMPVSE